MTIKWLNLYKVPEKDGIPAEIFVFGSEKLISIIYQIMCNTYKSRTVPKNWKDIKYVPLYKDKGLCIECNNHRVITLSYVIGKILVPIIFLYWNEDVNTILQELHWVQT